MGAQGTVEIDFGAFPGADTASVAVTGQGSIASNSLVEVWVFPTATTDHSVDEHIYDAPDVIAGNVVAGTGFTAYGKSREPPQIVPDVINGGKGPLVDNIQNTAKPYGKYTLAWCWN